MKNSKILKGLLIFLGAFLIAIGVFRLLDPITAFGNIGIILNQDPGLLSEARGIGGAMIGVGALIVLGAFKKKLALSSTLLAMIFYLGFGIARVIGLAFDGNPGQDLVNGIIVEFVFGLLALFALIKYRD